MDFKAETSQWPQDFWTAIESELSLVQGLEWRSRLWCVFVLAGVQPLLQPAGLQQQPVVGHLLRTLVARAPPAKQPAQCERNTPA